MQVQCAFCGKMFTLNNEAALAAMYEIKNEGAQHYDAPCSHCQRANRVSSERMEKTYLNWEAGYEEMVKQADEFEKRQAALSKQAAEAKGKPVKEKKKRKPRR